tara:strand:- start:508 stop:750 length:243 start_codon:yes stop_codon:yes gene_type:complete
MKKSDYIIIAKKLMSIADSGKTDKGFPSITPHCFNMEERKLLKELIIKCNEVEIYAICKNDGSDRRTDSEKKGKFSFQRG